MDINENKRSAFLLLKGICNSIIKNPCKEHPEKLKHVLNIVGDNIVSEFVEYILYPIKLQIFNKDLVKRDDTTCILLDCLGQILPHLKIKSEVLFIDIYSILCFSLVRGPEQSGAGSKEPSEELKIKTLSYAKLLFIQTDEKLLDSLYKKREFYSKLCVLIFNSLQFASKEKSISLRCLALECLLVFCRLDNLSVSESSFVDLDSAKVVKKCLPGIITECQTIISEGYKQNHLITVLALKLWSRSVSLVMADFHSSKCSNPIQTLKGSYSAEKILGSLNETDRKDKDVLKDEAFSEEWIRAAARSLSNATVAFTMLKLHPHSKVRKELVSSVTLILIYAPVNMSPSLGNLLDALIVLSEDSEVSVSKASIHALDKFKKSWTKHRGRQLLEDVKDCFCVLLNRLPRILHGPDDHLKESDLTLLCGYILLLGQDNFADFLASQQLLDKLINGLLEAATLSPSKVSLLEESTVRDLEDEVGTEVPWRNFSICTTPKLKIQLERIFHLLGSLPNLIDISATLLDIFNSSPLKRLETTLCINDIVLSSQQVADEKFSSLVKTIVKDYLEPYFWEAQPQQMLSESKKLVMQTCLCIEGIGKLAKAVGADNFSPFLLMCLYPLLEYAGSPYGCVALAGLDAMRSIASIYDGDVGNLIQNNVDYLSHHISVKLRHIDKQSSVLYVLSAVMNHSDMHTLPSLLEIINNVLFQSFDKFQSGNLNSYLHVFKTFLNCLYSWLSQRDSKFKEKTPEPKLIHLLLDYQEAKNQSENFEDLQDETNELEAKLETSVCKNEEEDPQEKRNVPNYVKLTEAIMLRSAHFLPSKDSGQQINAMQILEKGAIILMDHQDILLPVVHKIWSPLVERFEPSRDPLTIKSAFTLLATLAFTSKDFIRQRSLKQVLPKLRIILEKLSAESKLKPHLHGYRFSQKYKLQLEILLGLGDLAINIDLAGKEIYTLLEICCLYLSSTQPQPLQDASIDVFKKLSKLNRDMVWLHLMAIWPRFEFLTSNTEFQIKYELQINNSNHHFKKNVDKLLDSLEL